MASRTLEQLEMLAGTHGRRPASDVKARWKEIVEEAREGEVIITNHNRPEVVIVSIDRYAKLRSDAMANDPLTALRSEFDRELAALGERDAASKLREIFASSPARLAKAANNAASSRRKR